MILLGDPKPFRRLDHYRIHEYSRKLGLGQGSWLLGNQVPAAEAPGLVRNSKGNSVNNNNRLNEPLSIVDAYPFGKVAVTATGISSVPIMPGPGVIDGFFRRKRGRPPKDRLIQV